MGMTGLERLVAQRLRDNVDPWAGTGGVGSRKVSGALGRLYRKGFAAYAHGRWCLTSAGGAALDLARELAR